MIEMTWDSFFRVTTEVVSSTVPFPLWNAAAMADTAGLGPMPVTRGELKLVRLLSRCEALAADRRNPDEWRLEKVGGGSVIYRDFLLERNVKGSSPASIKGFSF